MENIVLGTEFLVMDQGTSEGTQDKYYRDGIWYKADRFGGEGQNEALISELLSISNLDPDEYVMYREIMINGEKGCMSPSFLTGQEECVSFYRLHQNVKGSDIATMFERMDFDDQAVYILDFLSRETDINREELGSYLGRVFRLDYLTLNDDRHMNNICLIFTGSGYRLAPIFDNGKSFFCGNKQFDPALSLSDNVKKVHFRPFTASIEMMIDRFPAKLSFKRQRLDEMLLQWEDQKAEILRMRMDEAVRLGFVELI
ncbi:MAG: hypothetical protein K6E84_09610 [Lachnospiraceae bacterium]|nr:hypothetical protein [Lachnospiraceae bacterium]